MKRVLLLTLMLVFGLYLYGQRASQITAPHKDYGVKVEYKAPVKDGNNFDNPVDLTKYRPVLAPTEDTIGNTVYDLQTNSTLQNRFYMHADGTLAATWTRGMENPPSCPDRGTGYNYHDGTSWGPMPTERIEDDRVGWPSYAPWGENGEMVVAHLAEGLNIATRPEKGTGEWSHQTFMGPDEAPLLTWPRVSTSGENNMWVHIIANSYEPYEGQPTALLYSRSEDGGETWLDDNIILDGLGEDYYTEISADDYVWAQPNGGAIAFLVASAWHDMFMMKSTDNGSTWEKTVIWEHPYPFFKFDETITDTFYCVDNSANITLDKNGKAHVVFGINRVLHAETGTTYTFFPFVDGIGYWNEDMETFSDNLHALDPYGHPDSELVENENLIGWYQDVNGNGEMDLEDEIIHYRSIGLSTMPTISVDAEGKILVMYASTTEGFDNGTNTYKHVWARSSPDGGLTWGSFTDMIAFFVAHSFDETIYPQLTSRSGDYFHYFYQADEHPGVALDDEHPYVENRIIYGKIQKSEIIGMDDPQAAEPAIRVSQNQPNPFMDNSIIMVNTTKPVNVKLNVYSITGQLIYSQDAGKVNNTHQFTIDGSELSSGIYFYSIEAGNQTLTKKMTVR
ncbi:MAG: T9SS type A sorting domain-containing protein [Bacteroidales bacterium]|nr:T9SS type A sorting domain-containing protein [Bacteroidales bacterium]